MGAKTIDDLVAYQFAVRFKDEVYQLIEGSARAQRDFRFRSQLEDAASGIERTTAEGFGRHSPAEFAHFLSYSLASLREAVATVKDGIRRGYFSADRAETALLWGTRCKHVTSALRTSQLRLADQDRRERRRRVPEPRRGQRDRRSQRADGLGRKTTARSPGKTNTEIPGDEDM